MTDQERIMLGETEQRSKSNKERIDKIETAIDDIRNDQKAIYSLATSVELIAQKVTNIEDKIDQTNNKVDTQTNEWREAEKRLTESQNEPYKRTANNINSIKVAIITAVCTFLATGAVGAIITLIK